MKKVWYGLLLILIASCSSTYKNNNIINKELFTDVLVDIHLTDGAMIARGYRVNKDSTKIKHYYEYVLIKHDITAVQLDNTIKYYSTKTDEYNKIYDEVMNKLAIKETEIGKKKGSPEIEANTKKGNKKTKD